jgi:hypothetical protein
MSRLVGYYGTFVVGFIVIPAALMWFIAGVLFHVQGLLLLLLCVAAPITTFLAWSEWQAFNSRRITSRPLSRPLPKTDELRDALQASLEAARQEKTDSGQE